MTERRTPRLNRRGLLYELDRIVKSPDATILPPDARLLFYALCRREPQEWFSATYNDLRRLSLITCRRKRLTKILKELSEWVHWIEYEPGSGRTAGRYRIVPRNQAEGEVKPSAPSRRGQRGQTGLPWRAVVVPLPVTHNERGQTGTHYDA